MAFEKRDNSGSLFKNKKKKPGDGWKIRDYEGQVMIDGVEYWVSAWIKSPKDGGEKFMSLAFESKEAAQQRREGQGGGFRSGGGNGNRQSQGGNGNHRRDDRGGGGGRQSEWDEKTLDDDVPF